MKILVLLLDAGIGGGQRVALQVSAALIERGHDLSVAVPGPGPAMAAFRDLGSTTYTIRTPTLRNPLALMDLIALLRKHDLIYTHTAVPGQILSQAAALLTRRTHVAHQHTVPRFSSHVLIGGSQRLLFRRLLRRARWIAVASHIRDSLMRLGVDEDDIHVISNGIAVPSTRGPKRRDGIGLRVGLLGRFDRQKGMDVFLEAVQHLMSRRLTATFVIGAAPGPFRDHERGIRVRAQAIGVPILDPGSRGIDFLQSLDIVVMPSRWEGSPLVLLEAMALGKPIVASDIPGIREIAPSLGAILVPPEDAGGLADAIHGLLASGKLRDQMGSQALERVQRFTLDRTVELVSRVLEASPSRG